MSGQKFVFENNVSICVCLCVCGAAALDGRVKIDYLKWQNFIDVLNKF